MSEITALFRKRERPVFMSRSWCVAWGKRALSLPALWRLCRRASNLRAQGAAVGEMAIIEDCRFEGPLRNLHIAAGAFVGEGCELVLHDQVTIGEQVVINRRVTILTASHFLRDPEWSSYSRPVHIGDRAWIATGAILLPGVSIGRGAVVGAGAVVRSDVPDYALAVGNPAMVTPDARCKEFSFDTAYFPAPFAAWLGKRK